MNRRQLTVCLLLSCTLNINHAFCGRRGIKARVQALYRPTTEERLNILENTESFREAYSVISNQFSKFKNQDLSGIEVMLRSPGTTNVISTKITDKEGAVEFEDASRYARYELSVETDVTIAGRTVRAKARNLTRQSSFFVWLHLRTDWITLKGKILTSDGSAAEGINVEISPWFTGSDSGDLYNSFPQQSAVSDTDGAYELECIKPLSMDMTMRYLINSNAAVRSQHFFFGQIQAKKPSATGYQPPQIQIPLISENVLKQSRRQLAIMNRLYGRKKEGPALKEREDISLPKSKGDVIFLPDIILDDGKTKAHAQK